MPDLRRNKLIRSLAEIDQKVAEVEETARLPLTKAERERLGRVRAILRRAKVDAEKMLQG